MSLRYISAASLRRGASVEAEADYGGEKGNRIAGQAAKGNQSELILQTRYCLPLPHTPERLSLTSQDSPCSEEADMAPWNF